MSDPPRRAPHSRVLRNFTDNLCESPHKTEDQREDRFVTLDNARPTATTIPTLQPYGVAVTPDGTKVYVANVSNQTVSVIDTATNTVPATIIVGLGPTGVAVSQDGSKVYVTNADSDSVSVIDTATNTVTATVPVGSFSAGVAVTPDGSKVYGANQFSNSVSVIATATNTVIGSPIGVGVEPIAFGVFIQPAQPAPRFAGTPGKTNCHGKSVSALARQFGGLNAAAAALGFSSVGALQNAILAFCQG
jgi:YVTN family beta-propeller protein